MVDPQEPQVRPIGAGDNRAKQRREDQEQNQAAAAPRARAALAEAKSALQRVENPIQKKQFNKS